MNREKKLLVLCTSLLSYCVGFPNERDTHVLASVIVKFIHRLGPDTDYRLEGKRVGKERERQSM